VNRASLALLASLVVVSALGETTEPTKIRITTWNLEWFPNGSPHDATPDVQAQRIAAAADILRPINPDIILLQEVRDYDACARLGEAIAPGIYHVAICSAFKEPFQSGLGKQQVAILSKYQARIKSDLRMLLKLGIRTVRGSLHRLVRCLERAGRGQCFATKVT